MQLLNRHHYHASDSPAGTVYIGRGAPLGNPFIIGQDGDRASVIDQYRTWALDQIQALNPVLVTALLKLNDDAQLVCSCAPAPCHGDVIPELRVAALARVAAGFGPPRMAYAGIGSRDTPEPMCRRMTKCAARLQQLNYILRSGAAAGADAAFEAGSQGWADIYLPWPKFNNHPGSWFSVSDEALSIASVVHPAFKHLGGKAKLLQGRNSYQVLGNTLREPADFVLCWTPDGAESAVERTRNTGGTGQAIELASLWGIPVFNMAKPDALDRLAAFLAERNQVKAQAT